MRFTLLSLVALSVCTAPAYAAQSSMRPGLWEMTTSSELLKLVPHIPPDQMQNLMRLAKQYGMEIPPIQNGAATSKTCITQAMADQNKFPDFYQNRAGCSARNTNHVGNRYQLDYACNSPQVKGSGSAEGVFTDQETFSGRTTFAGTIQGANVDEHADIKGRWIGPSCGAVKPLQ